MDRRVRVRFAPSPTGPLHIGGLRTALYNYLFAKHFGGDFILRIEDTDQGRFVEGAEEYIEEALRWCGIEPDESPSRGGPCAPYRQSERKAIYQAYAQQLIDTGKAYYAFDSPEDLERLRKQWEKEGKTFIYNQETRLLLQNSLTLPESEVKNKLQKGENYVIRLKVEGNDEVVFYDRIRGEVRFHKHQLDDKVLLKSDGMPTYHLANVVDDYQMKISHVIRGEEWLSSTPTHILLYEAFGWTEVMPQFAHLPLLLKPSGKGKLSKRDGEQLGFPVFPLSWKDPQTGQISTGYREQGYLPEAFLNFLVLQGWNPGTDQEIFSLQELIQHFSLDRVQKSGARFDIQKAIWFNGQYLRNSAVARILPLLKEEMQKQGLKIEESRLLQAFHLMKERLSFHKELFTKGKYLFLSPENFDWNTIEKKFSARSVDILTKIYDDWSGLEEWEEARIEQTFNAVLGLLGEKPGNIMPILRNALTGESSGPNLFKICVFLGKLETLNRITRFIETLREHFSYK